MDGSTHWYDAVAALVYVTHFVAIPVMTGLVWFRLRDRFLAWIVAVLAFTVVGVGGYVLYPAAPPWLASELGASARSHRISDLGLGVPPPGRCSATWSASVSRQQPGGGHAVAARRQRAAGRAVPVGGRAPALRVLLLGYVAAMGLTLVYTGEHYVVDVVAGWATAGTAVAVGTAVGTAGAPARVDRASRVQRDRAGGGAAAVGAAGRHARPAPGP